MQVEKIFYFYHTHQIRQENREKMEPIVYFIIFYFFLKNLPYSSAITIEPSSIWTYNDPVGRRDTIGDSCVVLDPTSSEDDGFFLAGLSGAYGNINHPVNTGRFYRFSTQSSSLKWVTSASGGAIYQFDTGGCASIRNQHVVFALQLGTGKSISHFLYNPNGILIQSVSFSFSNFNLNFIEAVNSRGMVWSAGNINGYGYFLLGWNANESSLIETTRVIESNTFTLKDIAADGEGGIYIISKQFSSAITFLRRYNTDGVQTLHFEITRSSASYQFLFSGLRFYFGTETEIFVLPQNLDPSQIISMTIPTSFSVGTCCTKSMGIVLDSSGSLLWHRHGGTLDSVGQYTRFYYQILNGTTMSIAGSNYGAGVASSNNHNVAYKTHVTTLGTVFSIGIHHQWYTDTLYYRIIIWKPTFPAYSPYSLLQSGKDQMCLGSLM